MESLRILESHGGYFQHRLTTTTTTTTKARNPVNRLFVNAAAQIEIHRYPLPRTKTI